MRKLRRNCRHHYYPHIENVSERTYTDEQLENIDNPPFEFDGVRYDQYQASQEQRKIERTVRKLRREKAAYEAAELTEDADTVKVRLRRLDEKYKAFSKAAGLPTQPERMKVYGTYQIDAEKEKAIREQRRAKAKVRQEIKEGVYPLEINPEKQARHMAETATPGRSVVSISREELQGIIRTKAGSGTLLFKRGTPTWKNQEIIFVGRKIGYTVNKEGDIIPANQLKIHYSKTGIHAVPFSGEVKK